MSLSVVLIGALVVIGIVVWMFFGGEPKDEEGGAAASTFRCKICGRTSTTFVDAHEHASADHDLAGHKIDESIEGV